MECCIYLLTHTASGKKYVGVTNNLPKRLSQHKSANSKVGRALRKYGIEAFKCEVLLKADRILCYELEVFYISKYRTTNSTFGYNIAPGGVNPYGLKRSEVAKRRMSAKKKGRKRQPHSEETKHKMSKAQKGRKGHSQTAETRERIGRAHKGKVVSEETKAKMSHAAKNRRKKPQALAFSASCTPTQAAARNGP